MKTSKLFLPLFAVFALIIGSIAAVPVYADYTRNGCPENYFSPEFGCQIAIEREYVAEKEEPMDLAALKGCPENYYSPEFGCQISIESEYSEEYKLVGEEMMERFTRGCPANYFEPEKGCQISP